MPGHLEMNFFFGFPKAGSGGKIVYAVDCPCLLFLLYLPVPWGGGSSHGAYRVTGILSKVSIQQQDMERRKEMEEKKKGRKKERRKERRKIMKKEEEREEGRSYDKEEEEVKED